MDYKKLQDQYDKIYSYFRTTTEVFDFLEWNGRILKVWDREIIVEEYLLEDLKEIGVL